MNRTILSAAAAWLNDYLLLRQVNMTVVCSIVGCDVLKNSLPSRYGVCSVLSGMNSGSGSDCFCAPII